MNTNRVKTDLIGWLFMKKNWMVALTECGNNADVFGIKRSFYTVEIEIKLSRSDLIGELRSIVAIKNSLKSDNRCKKYYKHSNYIGKWGQSGIPYWRNTNEFYFCVPRGLLNLTKNALRDTPYGLLLYKENQEYYSDSIEEIIRPKKMNMNKIKEKGFLSLLKRASRECQHLREELFRK